MIQKKMKALFGFHLFILRCLFLCLFFFIIHRIRFCVNIYQHDVFIGFIRQTSFPQEIIYNIADDEKLKFAVIVARSGGRWVFCRHKERSTLEIPGGHREPGETVAQTAERELREETGAEKFTLKRVCVYSVTGRNRVNSKGAETFGVLYFAEITSFGELKSEIAEIVLLDELPERWTYPEIQPALIAEAKRRGAIT